MKSCQYSAERMSKLKDNTSQTNDSTTAYYGVESFRAMQNFQITGRMMNTNFITNIAKIKKAAAIVNSKHSTLDKKIGDAIVKACDEIIKGQLLSEFIVDPIQGGAGTSANMNANEVIANRAEELLGGKIGEHLLCHPNDHVNMAQSTNDVIPTAGHLTTLDLLNELIISLKELHKALLEKSKEFDDVIKMGRTQLQDAVPMRLGQGFGAYACAIARSINQIEKVYPLMLTINLGATAIGTSINASPEYLQNITAELSDITGYSLVQADNLFDATGNQDSFVIVSGALKACAVTLSKISNDLRLLSSGPRTGIGEITLPAKQKGSSIMPGKVNPVIPEVVSQVAFLVAGHDATITMAADAGQLELNAFEPVMFYALFESITALTGAVNTLTENCIKGITANEKHCLELVESSIGIVTSLAVYIGYKKAEEIAKEALETGKNIRDIARNKKVLDEEALEKALNIRAMTEPHNSK